MLFVYTSTLKAIIFVKLNIIMKEKCSQWQNQLNVEGEIKNLDPLSSKLAGKDLTKGTKKISLL